MSWQHQSVVFFFWSHCCYILCVNVQSSCCWALSFVAFVAFVALLECRSYFRSEGHKIRDPSAWVLKTCKREIETHLGLNNVISIL